jgi:YidC/Oxa1 family membrane protein insertase
MLDKKTILVVAACMAVLIGGQIIINKIYPPIPKKTTPPTITNLTGQTTTPAPPTNVTIIQPDSAPVAERVTQVEPLVRPPEERVELSNDFVRIVFTSWGGGIEKVELLKHRANGSGNVILNYHAQLPALAVNGVPDVPAGAAYRVEKGDDRTVSLVAQSSQGTTITKQFFLGNAYELTGSVQVQRGAGQAPNPQGIELVIGTATQVQPHEDPSFLGTDWVASGKFVHRDHKKATKSAGVELVSPVWGAVKSQFFAMILTPSTNAAGVRYEAHSFPVPEGWNVKGPLPGVKAALVMPPHTEAAGAVEKHEFTYYAGPKEYKRLTQLGKGQEEVMQFGMFSIISVLLLQSMNFFHNIIPNYGIAIIIITILIKIIFWPIQAKSMKAMKEMQKVQPLMAKLKDKYKDDAQKLNAEMMKLYKEHKVNPFAGCLPMLVQIPVFIALFSMLRSAIELRGAPFLWIADMSQPDTIFRLFGLPVNPLPLAMVASMVWQQKITPTTADPQQAKIMMMMPIIMLLFFYNASAGLALYWTVQQLLSIAQQYWSLRTTSAETAPKPA